MDDQINSRMVELANYSSWYPQFSFGSPLQFALEVSLPEGWITICSGKQLENRVMEGREITRWSSPNDTDILVVASPHFKKKTFREAETNIEIYYTQMPEAFIDNEFSKLPAYSSFMKDVSAKQTSPPAPSNTSIRRSAKARAWPAFPGRE
jgi:hypothetical protein